ncbi:MAG: Mov34/MPN/PAD-1 family protein [Thermoanaerobaculia bacterium]
MSLLLALSLTIAYPFNEQTIARNDVQACFDHLFRAAYFGRANYERAAFLVMESDGTLDCHDWPATFSFKAEHWTGEVPDGTVAIAHTHPARVRQPSRDDIDSAARVGVPVFVVTQSWISMAAPDGTVTYSLRK